MLLVVLITGGFVVDAGPLYFSSRRWTTPLVAASAAWLAALLIGRRDGAVSALTTLGDRLERHAVAVALVIAVAAAGTGVGFGTFAASAADASGYVRQARLLAEARVSFDEPPARLVGGEWAPFFVVPLLGGLACSARSSWVRRCIPARPVSSPRCCSRPARSFCFSSSSR